jgi:hypothetical protein
VKEIIPRIASVCKAKYTLIELGAEGKEGAAGEKGEPGLSLLSAAEQAA